MGSACLHLDTLWQPVLNPGGADLIQEQPCYSGTTLDFQAKVFREGANHGRQA